MADQAGFLLSIPGRAFLGCRGNDARGDVQGRDLKIIHSIHNDLSLAGGNPAEGIMSAFGGAGKVIA